MKQINYKIYHQGCWCSETSEKFPEVKFKLLTPPIPFHKNKKGSMHRALWDITSENRNVVIKLVKYFKKHKDVIKLECLKTEPFKVILFTEFFQKNSTYDTVLRDKSLIVDLPLTENGYEVYSILTEEKYKLDKILNELEEIGELKILKIGKFKKEETILTEKQKQALQLAISHKYYSWPRKVTLETLAKKLSISRSAFQEHLRKAEAKIFPKLVKEKLKVME